MKKFALYFVLALFVLAMAVPALADGIITITGGALAVVPQTIDFGSHQLDGIDHTFDGTTTNWNAKDPTGTGYGWHVTVQAVDFKRSGDLSGSEKTIAKDGFTMKLLDADIATVYGNDVPTSQISGGYSVIGGLSPLSVLQAAVDKGMGEYTFLPTFKLFVPAETYAGSYNSVVTVAIVSAP